MSAVVESVSVAFTLNQPTSDTGIYLHRHAHEWVEIGAHRMPVGTWHPVFKCMRCGDVLTDLHVEVEQMWPDPESPISETEGGR